MYTKWTSHLKDPKEKERFEGSIIGSRHVLDHLKTILGEMESDLDLAEVNPKYYDTPNWDYRQAHNNGYRQALRYLKKFIDLDKQEIPNHDR